MKLQTRARVLAAGLVGVVAFGQAPVKIAVTSDIVRENFRGVGFHGRLFLDSSTREYSDQVIAKRWRELNPGFARVFHNWARGQRGVRDEQALDFLAREIVFMKENVGTEVYLTTSSPKDVTPGDNAPHTRRR
jgi:ribonuclease HI